MKSGLTKCEWFELACMCSIKHITNKKENISFCTVGSFIQFHVIIYFCSGCAYDGGCALLVLVTLSWLPCFYGCDQWCGRPHFPPRRWLPTQAKPTATKQNYIQFISFQLQEKCSIHDCLTAQITIIVVLLTTIANLFMISSKSQMPYMTEYLAFKAFCVYSLHMSSTNIWKKY